MDHKHAIAIKNIVHSMKLMHINRDVVITTFGGQVIECVIGAIFKSGIDSLTINDFASKIHLPFSSIEGIAISHDPQT